MSDCDELNDNDDFFDELIQAIQREESTPILGPGLLEAAIGVPFGSIVQDWCVRHHYPLPTYASIYHGGLPRLAQHLATTKSEKRAIRDLCNARSRAAALPGSGSCRIFPCTTLMRLCR
jgi:hypothetical protein